jgi:hypothetical protein
VGLDLSAGPLFSALAVSAAAITALAIFGQQIFAGSTYGCSDPARFTRADCLRAGGTWDGWALGYEWIAESWLSVFVLVTQVSVLCVCVCVCVCVRACVRV